MSIPLYWRMQKKKYGIVKELFGDGTGKIVSWTIVRASPEGFEAPYIVGIVKMKDGVKLVGAVCGVDIHKLEGTEKNDLINKNVSVVFRRLKKDRTGLCAYGYKFLLED